MPGRLFQSVKGDFANREIVSALQSAFKKNPRVVNGTYLGRNRIFVNGQEYNFQNTSGQTIATGATVAVQNIGRKAAATYAPTDLPTGLAVSGGGGGDSSSGTSTLVEHTHADNSSGGSTLTAVTSFWNFLLLNTASTMQAGLNRLDTYGMFVKTTVQSGATLTIPSGYQQIVSGTYTVDGDIVIDGDLVIL